MIEYDRVLKNGVNEKEQLSIAKGPGFSYVLLCSISTRINFGVAGSGTEVALWRKFKGRERDRIGSRYRQSCS